MQLYATDLVFAWARLEDHPQLATVRDLLAALPDADLLDGRRRARGAGSVVRWLSASTSVMLAGGAWRQVPGRFFPTPVTAREAQHQARPPPIGPGAMGPQAG